MEKNRGEHGFIQDTGTKNAIFINQLISKSSVVQKDFYLYFMNYTNAFNKVWHEECNENLRKEEIDNPWALLEVNSLHIEIEGIKYKMYNKNVVFHQIYLTVQ